jgi:hypothetical protein
MQESQSVLSEDNESGGGDDDISLGSGTDDDDVRYAPPPEEREVDLLGKKRHHAPAATVSSDEESEQNDDEDSDDTQENAPALPKKKGQPSKPRTDPRRLSCREEMDAEDQMVVVIDPPPYGSSAELPIPYRGRARKKARLFTTNQVR